MENGAVAPFPTCGSYGFWEAEVIFRWHIMDNQYLASTDPMSPLRVATWLALCLLSPRLDRIWELDFPRGLWPLQSLLSFSFFFLHAASWGCPRVSNHSGQPAVAQRPRHRPRPQGSLSAPGVGGWWHTAVCPTVPAAGSLCADAWSARGQTGNHGEPGTSSQSIGRWAPTSLSRGAAWSAGRGDLSGSVPGSPG